MVTNSNTDLVFDFTGKQSGATSVILVGVHGNERCGVDALNELLPELESKISRVRMIIAFGNPRAIEQDVRYTEANLNRMFKDDAELSESERKSYEYTRAQFLKQILNQADALLDVHASFTPESTRFIIAEPNAKDIAQALPIDLVVSGFDAVQSGGTDWYMNSIGKKGICVECGYLGDPQSTKIAKESIQAFLKSQGHLGDEEKSDVTPIGKKRLNVYQLYYAKSNDFTLAKDFADFEDVSAGQLIGTDGNVKVNAPKDSKILFACNCSKMGEEAFLLAETQR